MLISTRALQEQILEGWIRSDGRTNVALAASVQRSAAWLSVKLRSDRRLAFGDYDELDRMLDGRGALRSLLRGAALPEMCDARTHWDYNPSRLSSEPCYAWVRTANETTVVELDWGAFSLTTEIAGSGTGAMIVSPFSLPNPPVRVRLSQPGWVAFGEGRVGRLVPLAQIDGMRLLRLRAERTAFTTVMRQWLHAIADRVPGALIRGAGVSDGLVADVANLDSGPAVSTTQTVRPAAVGGEFIDHEGLVRGARVLGLANREIARRASMETGLKVSKDRVGRLFAGEVPTPESALLAAWTDRQIDGDGRHLAHRFLVNPSTTHFPSFWVGPIWIEVDSDCLIRLTWGRYEKRVSFVSPEGGVCWTRCADPTEPLHLTIEEGSANVTVGLGHRAGATDVNDNWHASSDPAFREIAGLTGQLAKGIVRQTLIGVPGLDG